MATKLTDATLLKVGDDEPIFVLRAQDKVAPYIIRMWALHACQAGCPVAKCFEALEQADAMEKWPTRKVPD